MGQSTRSLSEHHARQILAIERFLHIDCELALQRWVMSSEFLLWFFNKYVVPCYSCGV